MLHFEYFIEIVPPHFFFWNIDTMKTFHISFNENQNN